MMPSQISKKILLYIFILLLFGTINNKNYNNFQFPKIKQINVSGLSNDKNIKISKSLESLKNNNLFFLDRFKIDRIVKSNNYIEELTVFKRYPSSLNIKIKETNLLAYVNKDGKNLYLGSNGNLIESVNKKEDAPFIFGDFKIKEFFKLKKVIDKSNFKFGEIKNLFFFPSNRWDIETRSGILIKLPNNRMEENLRLSLRILEDMSQKKIKIIDLRQKDQVIING
tara:strand:+ start:376 stop:1050 length:675 start_codon:yes stop_codon:yes gene_type:complete